MTENAISKLPLPGIVRCAALLAIVFGCVLMACAGIDGLIVWRLNPNQQMRIAYIAFASVGCVTAVPAFIGGILLSCGKRSGRTTLFIFAWIAIPLMLASALVATIAADAGDSSDFLVRQGWLFHVIVSASTVVFAIVLSWMLLTGWARDWSDGALLVNRRPELPPAIAASPKMQVTALLSLIFAFLPPPLFMQMISFGLGMQALGAIRRSGGLRTGRAMAIIGSTVSLLGLALMATCVSAAVVFLSVGMHERDNVQIVAHRLLELDVAQKAYRQMKLSPENPGGDCTTNVSELLSRTACVNAMDAVAVSEVSAADHAIQGSDQHRYHGYVFSLVHFSDWGDQDPNKNWAILAWPSSREKLFPVSNPALMLSSDGGITLLKDTPANISEQITQSQVSQWREESYDSANLSWMTELDRPRQWDQPQADDATSSHVYQPAADGIGSTQYNHGLAEAQLPGRELRAICWFRAYLALAPDGVNASDAQQQIDGLERSLSGRGDQIVQKMNDLAATFASGSDQATAARKAIDDYQTRLNGVAEQTMAADLSSLISPQHREKAWEDYQQGELDDPLLAETQKSSAGNPVSFDDFSQLASDWLDRYQEVRGFVPEQNSIKSAQLQGHTDEVCALAFSRDGKTLVSGSHEHTARIWNLATNTESLKLEGHTDWVESVAFSPDGKTVITAGATPDNSIRLWDAATGKDGAVLTGHTSGVESVAVSPDGQTLASSSLDQTIRLWDLAGGTQKAQLNGHEGGIDAVAFSPDGGTLASASEDKTVRLWDVAAQSESAKLLGHTDAVCCVAFSPNGQTLASGSMDTTVRLWDVAEKKEIASLEGHTGAVIQVVFSRDGKTLISLSQDGTVRFWDIAGGKEKARLVVGANVSSMALSADNRNLATGNDDGTIQLWNLADFKFTSAPQN